MTKESDPEVVNARLADRIAAGDSSAEQELVRIYGPRVYAIAVARTGDSDTAHDLTQDVLLAVLEALRAGRLEDANKLSGFILGTTRNLINNFFRRSRPESSDSTWLLAALAVGACAPLPDPEPLTRGAHQVICRAEAPVNSHVTKTSCRPVDRVSMGDNDRDVGDVSDSGSPIRTGIFRAVSGVPQASPNAGEGSCGGNPGTD